MQKELEIDREACEELRMSCGEFRTEIRVRAGTDRAGTNGVKVFTEVHNGTEYCRNVFRIETEAQLDNITKGLDRLRALLVREFASR